MYMLITAGLYISPQVNLRRGVLLLNAKKKCRKMLYADVQPKAENRLQNKQISILAAEFAMENPKDQIQRDIQSARNNLFGPARGLLWII